MQVKDAISTEQNVTL